MTGPDAIRQSRDGSLPQAALAARLQGGREFETATRGVSMLPFLHEGDRVRVAAVDPAALRLGDLVAFWRGGELIVHRFAGWAGPGAFWEKGDNVRRWTRVPAEHLLGRVTEVARDGRWRALDRPAERLRSRWRGLRAWCGGQSFQAARAVWHRLRGRRDFTPEERLLLQVARLDPDPAVLENLLGGPMDWQRVLADARSFGVMPLLHHHLHARAGLPGAVRQDLAGFYQRQSLQSLRLFTVLGRVGRALDQAGVPFLLLKGAILAPWLYGDPALRPMTDLDLLIRPEHRQEAQQALAGLGFQAKGEEAGHYNGQADQEVEWALGHPPPLYLDRVCRLELHVAVLQRGGADDGRMLRAVWAAPARLPEGTTLALDHQVLFLAGHLHKHVRLDGWANLYWLSDLHELLRREGANLDGARLTALAAQVGEARALREVFGWLREGWGSPIPAGCPCGGGPPLARVLDASRRYREHPGQRPGQFRVAERFGQIRHLQGWRARCGFLVSLLVPTPAKLRARHNIHGRAGLVFWYLAHPFHQAGRVLASLISHVKQRLHP